MASKYAAASYEAIKDVPMPPRENVEKAARCARLFEDVGQFSEVLSFYTIAIGHLKAVEPVSLRAVLCVAIQGNISSCLHRSEHGESAELVMKDAIKNYENCQGYYALMDVSPTEADFLGDLDGVFADVLTHYGFQLALSNQPDEVSAIRKQLTGVVRRSTALRSKEASIMGKFDDVLSICVQKKQHPDRDGCGERRTQDKEAQMI